MGSMLGFLRLPHLILASLALTAPQGDEPAIRQLIQAYLDARDQDDAKALAGLFVPEVDQLASSGEWRKGRDALVAGTLANSKRTGGKRGIILVNVRLVAPGVAMADGRYELTGLAGGTSRQMWASFTCVKRPDGWRISAIRNMLPAPVVPGRNQAP